MSEDEDWESLGNFNESKIVDNNIDEDELEEELNEAEIIKEENNQKHKEKKEGKKRVNINKVKQNIEINLIDAVKTGQNEITYIFNQKSDELSKLIASQISQLKQDLIEYIDSLPIKQSNDKNYEKLIIMSFINNFHKHRKKNTDNMKFIKRNMDEIAKDINCSLSTEFVNEFNKLLDNQLLEVIDKKNRLLITNKALELYQTEIESLYSKKIEYYKIELEKIKNLNKK